MSEEEHAHWTGEKNAELYGPFIDLFTCPLCRYKPLEITEAYFDECPNAVFTLVCNKCHGFIEYFVGGDTLEETREMLHKARCLAVTP